VRHRVGDRWAADRRTCVEETWTSPTYSSSMISAPSGSRPCMHGPPPRARHDWASSRGARSGSITTLGPGLTIEPVMRMLEERATRGQPLPIGVICVHTSGPAEGDAMVVALAPWYRVRRVVAHSFLAAS
jgi:hypothetical protein